jgi:hypothetical protein
MSVAKPTTLLMQIELNPVHEDYMPVSFFSAAWIQQLRCQKLMTLNFNELIPVK